MRAKRTSTPTSSTPQKELQKSALRFDRSGEVVRAYLDSDVVEAWRLAVISGWGGDKVCCRSDALDAVYTGNQRW
jgi:hypothetical protein